MSDAERTEVHMLVDYLLMVAANDSDGTPPLMGEMVGKFARELRRLRDELETRTNELHWVEHELADAQEALKALTCADVDIDDPPRPGLGAALVEAISIARALGRRGLLSMHERERLRALERVVPQ